MKSRKADERGWIAKQCNSKNRHRCPCVGQAQGIVFIYTLKESEY